MHSTSSYASTWKTALEEDEAREESASSFPAIAPSPIGGTRLSSLQQHTSTGWKQQQQYLQQKTRFATVEDHWGTDVDSPSKKDHFQHKDNKHISNDFASGWSDQLDTSQHSRESIWTDTDALGWSDQRDVSPHSRASIWTDEQSRSSYTSTGTGTTSYTGTYSSQGTHPFAATGSANTGTYSSQGNHPFAASASANPTATSGTSHHHDDPLFGNLATLSLGGGHDSSQHPYYKGQQQHPHAPAPRNPYYNVTKEYDSLTHNSELSVVSSSSSSLNSAAMAWSGAASATADADALGSPEAIRQLMKPAAASSYSSHADRSGGGGRSSNSSLKPSLLEMDGSSVHTAGTEISRTADLHPILPQALQMNDDSFGHMMPPDDEEDDDEIEGDEDNPGGYHTYKEKKWLLRMNRKLAEIPVGELDPATIPLSAVMNTWAKIKDSQTASMVEMWLKRAQQEYDSGNKRVVPTAKMYTMAGTWLL
jgi:hypothetical protein